MRADSYRPIQVSAPGKFELVGRAITQLPPEKVRLRVEACGVRHSDVATVDGLSPDIVYPRVPGHEAIGKIDAIGIVKEDDP
jgi:propanol-preferring alcohol dehydrogenase